jgi:hypothetical protein
LLWSASAVALLALACIVGLRATGDPFAILLDDRERFSLSRLQLVAWTAVVLSLLKSVAALRILAGRDALAISIADELLVVMGIALGTSAVAEALKSSQDASHPEQVAVGRPSDRPRWVQLFLAESGAGADRTIDVAKFQNLLLTVVVIVVYCANVLRTLGGKGAEIDALPGFSQTMLVLVGVSHVGYLAGKLPAPVGVPSAGLRTVQQRNAVLLEQRRAGARTTQE